MLTNDNAHYAVVEHHYYLNGNIFDTAKKIPGRVQFFDSYEKAEACYMAGYGKAPIIALLVNTGNNWYGNVVIGDNSSYRTFTKSGEPCQH